MEIRPAREADLDDIGRIQSLSRQAAQWNPADYLSLNCTVAIEEGRVAGFLVSRSVADEREILNVAVDPALRGQGFGSALVRNELTADASAWFLEVRESNDAARSLYRKAGFEEAGRRPGYYSDPVEVAIVMRIFS